MISSVVGNFFYIGWALDGGKALLRMSHFSSFLVYASKIALVQFLENSSDFLKVIRNSFLT